MGQGFSRRGFLVGMVVGFPRSKVRDWNTFTVVLEKHFEDLKAVLFALKRCPDERAISVELVQTVTAADASMKRLHKTWDAFREAVLG